MAFVKRLLQVCCGMGAGFVCGSLYLVSEVLEKHGGVRLLMRQSDMKPDEEEEHFEDVKEDEEHRGGGERGQSRRTTVNRRTARAEVNGRPSVAVVTHRYDPHKRDPLFAQSHHSALWELTVLLGSTTTRPSPTGPASSSPTSPSTTRATR